MCDWLPISAGAPVESILRWLSRVKFGAKDQVSIVVGHFVPETGSVYDSGLVREVRLDRIPSISVSENQWDRWTRGQRESKLTKCGSFSLLDVLPVLDEFSCRRDSRTREIASERPTAQ
jgi:hypothetical protein